MVLQSEGRSPRVSRLLVGLALTLLVVVACGPPGLTPGRLGYTNAKAPTYGQVTAGEQPDTSGEGVNSGLAYWNLAAGRTLFVRTDAAPQQIRFGVRTPIIAYAETPLARRVVAWADQKLNPDGSMRECVVEYDPTFIQQQVPGRALNARVWAHEIGHCLDLEAHQACFRNEGVMANCSFWERVLMWWGPTLADVAQLKAAGYRQ